jgi:hypothetical protein
LKAKQSRPIGATKPGLALDFTRDCGAGTEKGDLRFWSGS